MVHSWRLFEVWGSGLGILPLLGTSAKVVQRRGRSGGPTRRFTHRSQPVVQRVREMRVAAEGSVWVLTDAATESFVHSFELHPADAPGTPPGWWVTKETLRGGLRDGVDLIGVSNGPLTFWVLPTRGMGIWKGQYHDL